MGNIIFNTSDGENRMEFDSVILTEGGYELLARDDGTEVWFIDRGDGSYEIDDENKEKIDDYFYWLTPPEEDEDMENWSPWLRDLTKKEFGLK